MKPKHGPITRSSEETINPAQVEEPVWEQVFSALRRRRGVTIFLGRSDTGKTTCLRAAATHLARFGILPLAIVDADIGQSTIGPPTSVGLSLLTTHNPSSLRTYNLPCHALSFVGSVSPVGYLLQTLIATKKLVDKACRKKAKAVLVDTTGLVSESVGFQLKLNKIALLEPRHIVAFQYQDELEALFSVLSLRPKLTVHRLPVSRSARTRSRAERYRYRVNRFRSYFREATGIRLGARKLTVLSPPHGVLHYTAEPLPSVLSLDLFSSRSLRGYLVGLNDASNQTLALGLLEGITPRGDKIDIVTPLRDTARVRIIQMSNIRLARTGEELERSESEHAPR